MLYQIATLLLDVIGGLLTGACLLRLYMQWQRVPFSNPVGALVFALTDWFIMPLRRLIPPTGQWDISSLVGGLLVFVDTVKELPLTFALRPFDFDTLAVRVYQYASDERLGAALLPALLILGLGLIAAMALVPNLERLERR